MDLAELTDGEFRILSNLWKRGQTVGDLAVSIYGVRGHSQENGVKKILERLEDKGCIDRWGRGVPMNPFVYYPIITPDDLSGKVLTNLSRLLGMPTVERAVQKVLYG